MIRPSLVLSVLLISSWASCVTSEPWPAFSPPSRGTVGSFPLGNSPPVRVAQLIEGDANGYMMAVATRGTKEVGRWGGPIDWFREMPARIRIDRTGRRWSFSSDDARSLEVNAPNRERGGIPIARWASKLRADRVVVIVVPNPGEPDDDASRDGLDTHGQGRGYARQTPTHTARVRGPDTRGDDDVDIGQGEPGDGQGVIGDGQGMGRSRGAERGRGSHDIGTQRGNANGSDSPSWVENPLAETVKHGGRIPKDHGKDGGSAAGKPHATGHSFGAGWLNVIDVPVKMAGAAAVVAIVMSADIAGFAQRLFQRVIRGVLRKRIEKEVLAQAKQVAKKRHSKAHAELRRNGGTMSPAQMADAVKQLPDSLELAFYDQLRAHASKQADTYWSIAARARQESGDIAEHAGKLATENMAAWRQIRDVADDRAQAIRAAARPPDAVARQPYDPHKWRADLNAEHPGKVTSSTVPDPKRPNVGRRREPHRKTGIPYDSRGFPIFDDVAMYDTRLARSLWLGQSRRAHMRAATRELRDAIRAGKVKASKFDAAQLRAIESGKAKIPGYTWHHHQHHGRMQLIPERYHKLSGHVGGDKLWQ